MEEQREALEQQTKETVEGLKTETVSGQSIQLTEEEKITILAEEVLAIYPSEVRHQLEEQTRNRIRIERQQFFSVLDEAEEELKILKWHSIKPISFQRNAHGFRGLFVIIFGNFYYTKEGGWIYRPNQSQMISIVKRWVKKRVCERFANDLRENLKDVKAFELKPRSEGVSTMTDIPLVESKAMIEFKKNISNQIKSIRDSV